MSTIRRTAIGAVLLALVGSGIVARIGHAGMAIPLLVGVTWGLANVALLGRVVWHLRPDRPIRRWRIVADILVKGPLMYGIACYLLFGRSGEEIVGGAIGLGLVLFTVLLQALGALLVGSDASPRTTGVGAQRTASVLVRPVRNVSIRNVSVRHVPVRNVGRA